MNKAQLEINKLLNVNNTLIAEKIKTSYPIPIWKPNEFKNIKYTFSQPLFALNAFVEKIHNKKRELEKPLQELRVPNMKPKDPAKFKQIQRIIAKCSVHIKILTKHKAKLIETKFISFVKKLIYVRFHTTVHDIHHKQLVRHYLSIKQNNICAVCGTELNEDCTYEHLKARCHKGLVSVDNGVATHRFCNLYLGILDKNRKELMLIENDDYDDYNFEYDKYEHYNEDY